MADKTPEGFDIANCRSCSAPIVWATSSGGRSMPVDAEPVEDGNVELAERPGLFIGPVATVLTGPSLFGGPLRKPHFATCPQAEMWRQR
ncbi:hypothetical protein OHA21_43740 [Actinoplanes sp. NBC_00393]|uniref:hypothetical protein n=1 Tax=Actinoplanes sp. NBC_00393 TaxID=2975953 RepID=UPI002E1EC329